MRGDVQNEGYSQIIINRAGICLQALAFIMYFRHTTQEFNILVLCVFFYL